MNNNATTFLNRLWAVAAFLLAYLLLFIASLNLVVYIFSGRKWEYLESINLEEPIDWYSKKAGL